MKKFLLFPVVFILGLVPDFCFAVCGERHISFQGRQKPGNDEFVYKSTKDYEDAIVQEEDGNKSFSLTDIMWECDEEQGCKHNTAILVPAGHAWDKNKNIPETTLYLCTYSWGDAWEKHSLTECNENFYENLKRNPGLPRVNMNGTTDKPVYRISSNGGKVTKFCYTDDRRLACIKEEATTWLNGECQCLTLNGKERKWNGKSCVELPEPVKPSPVKQEPVKPVQPTNPGTKTSCVQQRCGGLTGSQKSECVTCCYVPASLAKWENGVCKCQQNPNQKFNPLTLQCEDVAATVAPQPVAPQYDCDTTKLAQVAKWKVTYGSNLEVSTLINIILDYCNGATRVESVFNAYYVELQALIDSLQKSEAEAAAAAKITAQINASKTKISAAVEEMNAISAGFDDSVWKNEEGKFNTSRLVSDSVAGVVLGTAGGLITSNVVKKNQVENGFEDIQCTVGGQVVAGWGDQFRVGIQ